MNDKLMTKNIGEFPDEGILEAIMILELVYEYGLPDGFTPSNVCLAYDMYNSIALLTNDARQCLGFSECGTYLELLDIYIDELKF